MGEVFRTVHGSHLYGLAHEDSDRDVFVVTFEDRGRVRHVNVGGEDTATVGWRTFLELAASGSHQSCEALFSPHKHWSSEWAALRPIIEGMRVSGEGVFLKYERTIRKFAFGDFKRRRHAARLSLNLAGLRTHGRFNPVLTGAEAMWAHDVAELEGADLLEELDVPMSSSGATDA